MKWAVRKGKSPTQDADEKFMFEEINLHLPDGDPDLDMELFTLGYVEWVTYPGPNNNFAPLNIHETTKRKYEIYCGGFLYYHDQVFKQYAKGKGYSADGNGNLVLKTYPEKYMLDGKEFLSVKFEHKLYFEWFKVKGKTMMKGNGKNKMKIIPKVVEKDMVRIYINPTPPELNSNPPPPPPPPPPES